MKAYWGSEGIAPRILDLGTRWAWVVSFTPQLLYPQEKSPRYPLDRRLGGAQSQVERGSEEKSSHPLPGLEPPIIQPVAQSYTTELSRLLANRVIIKRYVSPVGNQFFSFLGIGQILFQVFCLEFVSKSTSWENSVTKFEVI
jgi:hypothetical protein